MPIQPAGARGIRGTVEVLPSFHPALEDLDGFSHIYLLYHFHRSKGYLLKVTPFMDSKPRGLFATRAPVRPNPIGLSVVRLIRIEKGTLHIQNVDILDGTPLLDIKPYVPDFDQPANAKTGWFDSARQAVSQKQSDDRFC
jgi:tRNA-Thr(GGU) m(6)t(6)A37 methyltransferase TsaA